jgi:hypothetical protein
MAKTSKKTDSAEPKRPIGRPSEFTPEQGDQICKALATGESLHSILSKPGMPCRMTVVGWLATYSVFASKYAHAREIGLDVLAEIALKTATTVVDPADVQKARLAWDAQRWHLSKMLPRKYGDRVTQEHVGADGQAIGLQAVGPKLTPAEVVDYVKGLLTDCESKLGLPLDPLGDDKDRIKAIVNSGKPLPPSLYRIIHADAKED